MSNYGDRLLQPMRQQIYDRLSQFQAACDKQFADLRLELTHSITQLTDQLVEDLQLQLISERDEPNNPIHFTTDDDNDVAFCCVDEDILYDETLDGDSEAMVDADSDDAFADAHTLEGQLDDDVANDIEGPSLTLKLETGFDNDDNDDNATVDAAVADVQPPPAKRRRASKKVYQCEICAYIVADRHRFQLHQLSSHGHSASTPLDIAGDGTQTPAPLQLPTFECDLCQRRFMVKQSLLVHMRTHTGERPYMCHLCCRSYKQHAPFNRHMRSHREEREYKCLQCGRAFLERASLTVHVQSHTGERPHECPVCQRGFSKRYHVRKHLKTLHGVVDVDAVLPPKVREWKRKRRPAAAKIITEDLLSDVV